MNKRTGTRAGTPTGSKYKVGFVQIAAYLMPNETDFENGFTATFTAFFPQPPNRRCPGPKGAITLVEAAPNFHPTLLPR